MKHIKINFIILVILLCICANMGFAEDYEELGATAFSDSFESHLPLIILEQHEGHNTGVLSVSDNGSLNNTDSISFRASDVEIHTLVYKAEEVRPKADYFFSLPGDSEENLLNLGAGSQWLLLGGMYDKSLIRNYLGYTLAAQILENAPKSRFCEVLLKDSNGYNYRGVYLLAEGGAEENTIFFERTEHYWSGFNQVIVSDGDMGTFILQNARDADSKNSIDTAVALIGDMFNSTDTNYFLQYRNIIDKESFYVYFLINEILGNYEDMNEDIYTYNTDTKRLHAGPTRSFERSLDNKRDEFMNIKQLRLQNAPFYQFMIRDGEFINSLIGTGKSNAEILSGGNINKLIDSAVTELGRAQERDWQRWGYFYFGLENSLDPYTHPPENASGKIKANGLGFDEDNRLLVEVLDNRTAPENAPNRLRQFENYTQEIIKLKYYANTRPVYVKRAVTLLRNQNDLLGAVNAYELNTSLTILFFAILLLSTSLSHRKIGA